MPLTAAQKLVLFPSVVRYLLLDRFGGELAAGAVNGTPAEPGPGTRTVTDTNSKLSITGGVASFATGGVGAGDPGLWYPSQARVFGKALIGTLIDAGTGGFYFGFDTAQVGDPGAGSVRKNSSVAQFYTSAGGTIAVGSLSASTAYTAALVLRAAGLYLFIKGGAFTNWTLLWQDAGGNGANVFPMVTANGNASVFTADAIRVPDALYIVPVLAYDTFTRANGALGSSETSGPDGQAVAARAWTGATFAVSSNAAVNTPTLGADVIVNGGFGADTDWTKGSGWTIAAGVATFAGSAAASLTEAVVAVGDWYQHIFTVLNYVSGSVAARVGGNGVARTANGTYTSTLRAADTAAGIRALGAGSYDVDDVSVKALTLSELFASLQVSTADVLADVNVTGPTATAGIQAGLVCNLDSAATPANFVIAYLDGAGNAKLDKCVAGTYTTVISAAVTYSAGATLRVIKSGTSYSLFYNGAAVGSTSTISDAGIISNTLHGLFSTSASNSLDNFQVMARGTGNEYAGLDAF